MNKITILMPTLNAQTYLIEALESIQAQDMREWELWVLDGGSSDLTLDIVHGIAQNDERISVKISPGIHPTDRVNAALYDCSSPYIAFMHADDVSSPTRLTKQYEFMDSHPDCALLGSATHYWLHEKTNPMAGCYQGTQLYPTSHDDIKCRMLFWWCFSHPSSMINRKLVTQDGIKLENSYRFIADYHFNFRLAMKHRVENLPESLLSYRHHPRSDGPVHREEIRSEQRILKHELLEITGLGQALSQESLDTFLCLAIEQDRVLPEPKVQYKALLTLFKDLCHANSAVGYCNPGILKQVMNEYLRSWLRQQGRSRVGSNTVSKLIRGMQQFKHRIAPPF